MKKGRILSSYVLLRTIVQLSLSHSFLSKEDVGNAHSLYLIKERDLACQGAIR